MMGMTEPGDFRQLFGQDESRIGIFEQRTPVPARETYFW